MRKKHSLGIIFVIIGFILGFIANVVARQFLPCILPESMQSATGLFAFLIQLIISVLAVYIAGVIIRKQRMKRG